MIGMDKGKNEKIHEMSERAKVGDIEYNFSCQHL